MELEIIRHKTAEEYFKGFYPSEMIERYSFQLRRMFESGSAKEGDYFVVKDNCFPLINAEIYRTNTRRIWDKPPGIAEGISEYDDRISAALHLIMENIDGIREFDPSYGVLEIVIDMNLSFSEQMKKLCIDHGYSFIDERQILSSKDVSEKDISVKDNIFIIKKMTELPPAERFRIVGSNGRLSGISGFDEQELYQDYLELGYLSEDLWSVVFYKTEVAGLVMPVFSSGIKDRIELINYIISEKNEIKEKISDIIYSSTIEAALKNGISKIEAAVDTQDVLLINNFEKADFKKKSVIESYIK